MQSQAAAAGAPATGLFHAGEKPMMRLVLLGLCLLAGGCGSHLSPVVLIEPSYQAPELRATPTPTPTGKTGAATQSLASAESGR
jgi:hypothetical protein